MKRFFIFTCLISLFLFTGCELMEYLFMEPGATEYEEATKTVHVNSSGNAYLVKLNVSDEKIGASYTGKVTSVTKNRSVDEIFDQDFSDTDSFIRNLNFSINEIVADDINNDNSRAVSAADYIKTGSEGSKFSKGATKTFWSFVESTDSGNSGIPGQVETTCKYVGKHCYIFADDKNAKNSAIKLSSIAYENLGKKFDACYELETQVIGNPFYEKYHSQYFVPCNEKIIILVSDLFGDAYTGQENEGGTLGYFYNGDLFDQTYLDNTKGMNLGVSKTSTKYVHANGFEMFYIDAYFLAELPDTVYSTLVHEFNHMINFVMKTVNGMTRNPGASSFTMCSKWYTEMLAMVTEDMFQDYLEIDDQSSPKGRLPYFNNFYNYGFKNWDDSSIDQNYMYANTYGFGAFLARNFGGVKLIKEIAQNYYVDEESISAALKKVNNDSTLDFKEALRKFANCLFEVVSDETVYTFNKSAGNQSDVLFFSAIDLNKIKVVDSKGRTQTYPPKIYTYAQQVDLYPYGFSVHKIGTDVESFVLAGNNNKKIDYFILK